MAIRKPHPRSQSTPRTDSKSTGWPYAVLRQTLSVQKDGSVRIPASIVRLIAESGEEVSVAFLSDGHLEIEGQTGRTPPPPSTPGARVFASDEAFSAALEATIPDR
jgi:hypothetical protein